MSTFEGPQPQADPGSTHQAPRAPDLDHDHDHHHSHIHGHGDVLHTHAQHIDAAPPLAAKENGLEAANIAYFDALSHDFDKRHPDAADAADRLARALRRVLVLDEDATAVLDYACGSGKATQQNVTRHINNLDFVLYCLGQVSRALAPHVAQLVGVDISPRMVQVYNARANAQGL